MKFITNKLDGLKKEQVLIFAYLVVIIAGIVKTYFDEVKASVTTFSMPANKRVVVIDAGHGGWDPGMIGLDGTKEKEINLLIAEKLQAFLELGGATVIVTRSDDAAVGDTKREDLNDRRLTADTSGADMLISIHQNSYPQQSVRGLQVFYYGESEESKKIAEFIHEQASTYLDKDNKRIAKANMDYYLLRRTTIPAVIVECGFLSNPAEGKMLTVGEYQERVAWTIYMGILNYFADKPRN